MSEPRYSVTVQLTGTDGNAFALIGAVTREIRRNVGEVEADEFARDAMNSGSYGELLTLIQTYVTVV